MFAIQEKDHVLHFSMGSDMRLVDRFVALAKEFMEREGCQHFSEIIIVLRELLINAVEHGNGRNREKRVQGRLEALGHDRFCIEVQDEGLGVDPETLSFTMPEDPSQDRSRGFALIHAFSDEIRFSQTPSSVRVWVSAPLQTHATCRMQGERACILPGGDITAASAENLRRLLLKTLDQGIRSFCLDLSATSDIDSIGLSLLIGFARMLRENGGGSLEILHAREDLKTLFRMTRLDRIYTLLPDTAAQGGQPC
ncbi:ATP-binding protein [Desulfobotulus sp.]|jgi:anti-anti-sigma factor|uniref:ATP-binding protein n=1 Tax=Desulfobotulus sp. TaxID=1940337 RepID=UPI002A367B78|nr:ATP-binding protein [Desulfobotulus sp.]MDY0161667.1 ATP-binding protein [Desulfobotulus sp.]